MQLAASRVFFQELKSLDHSQANYRTIIANNTITIPIGTNSRSDNNDDIDVNDNGNDSHGNTNQRNHDSDNSNHNIVINPIGSTTIDYNM